MPPGKIILSAALVLAKDRLPRRAGQLWLLLLPCLLVATASRGAAQETAEADEQLLKKASAGTDAAGLLAFFRSRTLTEEDIRQVADWIRQLDDRSLSVREQAIAKLVNRGRPALPALRKALDKSPLEVVRRAEECIRKIETGPGPELPAAAARLLSLRRPPEGVEVLVNYLPFADDEGVREEVLASLGVLGIGQGKVDPRLVACLRATAADRRAAAVYVLAQSGGVGQREVVRQLLADPDPKVRDAAAAGLVGKLAWGTLQESSAADETILRDNKVAADGSALVDFLRRNSPGEAAQKETRQLIRQLGDGRHRMREEATARLVKFGPSALAFLKDALTDPDAEIVRRSVLCIDKIKRGPGPALPAAVIRLLTRKSPPDAVSALLGYLPFVEDEMVEEEALTSLCLLSVRQLRVDPLLPRVLADPLPARRAAAAFVLGKVGTRADCADLAKLLHDPLPRVRFRAVQGLIAASDSSAVPELINLVAEAPSAWSWQVHELLMNLGGENAPAGLVAEVTMEGRKKAVAAWGQWWRQHQGTMDLTRLGARERNLGLVLVCEYDSVNGRPGGRIWEAARGGKPRWEMRNVFGPMDAQMLPGGRVLVAENMARKVTERDLKGTIRWEHAVPNNPIACQRLPNGNTFIATYTQLLEVTPTHQVIHSFGNSPGFYIFSARRMRNGNIVCMTSQGAILEVDLVAGREVRRIQVPGPVGGWCSAEALPGGRYLVAMQNLNKVIEVDATGKTYWEAPYQGVFRASRLPNGHTLAVSMTTRRVAEMDRSGAVRWEATCEGRPWQVRYR
jgi:HEAT repeat protein